MSQERTSETPVWRTWPFLVGYVLTAVFIVFWIMVAAWVPSPIEACQTNFCVFWRSNPNEIGDTFAGLFGSLAFVWIIVTVMVQGIELREQRKEITDARIAQQDQAAALNAQIKILEDEQKQRQELRFEKEFEQRLRQLILLFEHEEESNFFHTFLRDNGGITTRILGREFLFIKNMEMENDSRIRMSATHAKRVFDQYTIANSARCDVPLFEEISRRLKALVKLKPKLSADQMVRFETLRISDLDVVTDWLIGLAKSQQNPK